MWGGKCSFCLLNVMISTGKHSFLRKLACVVCGIACPVVSSRLRNFACDDDPPATQGSVKVECEINRFRLSYVCKINLLSLRVLKHYHSFWNSPKKLLCGGMQVEIYTSYQTLSLSNYNTITQIRTQNKIHFDLMYYSNSCITFLFI